MPRASVPETDLGRIRRWCEGSVPADAADRIKAEFHRRGRSVTICESRAPWAPGLTEWDHLPMAQLRFRPESRDWSLHWADRKMKVGFAR